MALGASFAWGTHCHKGLRRLGADRTTEEEEEEAPNSSKLVVAGCRPPPHGRINPPPRACEAYWDEWKHCKSILNLFHHYYTYGEAPSCTQWKRDYKNCREWEKRKSLAAKEALCKSERDRVAEKEKHTPVWTLRKSPPMDWYLPLDEDKPK